MPKHCPQRILTSDTRKRNKILQERSKKPKKPKLNHKSPGLENISIVKAPEDPDSI